jgi:UDP-N-acetyl-D-mannosaminuronate dehydrogenase
VGTATATPLAARRCRIGGVDVNTDKAHAVNSGHPRAVEPGHSELITYRTITYRSLVETEPMRRDPSGPAGAQPGYRAVSRAAAEPPAPPV